MKKALLGIATILVGLCSCDTVGKLSDLSEEQQKELSTIEFNYTFNLWGTEKPIVPGDKIGLFASSPINANNILITMGPDSILKCSENLKWNLDSKISSVTFVGYAPYSEQFQSGTNEFFVQKDQSTAASVKKSDLIVAATKLTKKENLITLDFSHKMSRLSLYIKNQSSSSIESVFIGSICEGARFDTKTGNVEALTTNTAEIRTGLYTSADLTQFYSALVPPQSANPVITISLANGKIKTFTLGNYTFSSGQQWSNASVPIVITDGNDDIPAGFALQIKDWNDGGSIVFIKQ